MYLQLKYGLLYYTVYSHRPTFMSKYLSDESLLLEIHIDCHRYSIINLYILFSILNAF